jgi:pyrophosphatase PpaX
MAGAIEALRRAGVPVAVVTSKTRPVAERGLRLTGIEVDLLVGPKDAARPKPHPDPVLLALERFRASPARSLMVGDSPHDLVAGRAAGARTAAVSWTVLPREELAPLADHWLETSDDLLRLALGAG